MDADERARIAGELLGLVALVHQAHVGNEVTVTVPDDVPPTDVEVKEALSETMRLIGKLMFSGMERVETLDAAPPAPLFALLGMLADEAWPLREAGVDPAQGRALSGLLTLIDLAAEMALGICEGKPINDADRIISAANVLVGGSAGERHTLRMVVDCLREGRREYRAAVNEHERAGSLAQVMAELPVILQRDPVSGAEAAVARFLSAKPSGESDGPFFEEVSVALRAAFRFSIPAKSINNAMQLRGKERLTRG